MTKFLKEIANWSIEAKEESSSEYFFHFDDVAMIESGKRSYVIGRKGTGKTAIAEHLHRDTRFNKFSRLLSFKNFPFNSLYKHADHQYNRPNQYISIWTYVIYHYICSMLSENQRVASRAEFDMKKSFSFDIKDALAGAVKKITDRSYNLNMLGFEAGLSSGSQDGEFDFNKANSALREFIRNIIDDSEYFIVFDELDEDYRDILNPDRREGYFELLISLFKAVQNIRADFSSLNANLRVVIFLRDDIFDLCRDVDKNKWLDRAVVLRWNESQLRNLVSFRLSQAARIAGEQVSLTDAWNRAFAVSKTRYGTSGGKVSDTFKYMTKRTFLRPRDVISYIRECARTAIADDAVRITNEHIKEAAIAHSSHMRREIIDEMFPLMEDISEVLEVLSKIRKQVFSRKEFNDRYREYQNGLGAAQRSKLTETQVLNLLHHFNVIGSITSGGLHTFAYNSDVKVLNHDETLCVHSAMLRSLSIV